MDCFVPFTEVVSDSPRFRRALHKNESGLEDLESRLERLLKTASTMTEAAKANVAATTNFLASLWELSAYFAGDKANNNVTSDLNKLVASLQGES